MNAPTDAATPHFSSFDEFWPHYVREHRVKATRLLHFAGTSAALGVAAYALLSGRHRALLAAPLLGYGPAWVGHFFIENNKPATFDHPLWSLRGDFRMIGMMLAGTMDDEVARCLAMVDGEADAEAEAEAEGPSNGAGSNGAGSNGAGSNGAGAHDANGHAAAEAAALN